MATRQLTKITWAVQSARACFNVTGPANSPPSTGRWAVSYGSATIKTSTATRALTWPATSRTGSSATPTTRTAPTQAHRTTRILTALDPVAADQAATRRRRDRVGVCAHPDEEPGLSQLHAYVPSDVTAKSMVAIEKLARELHAATTTNKNVGRMPR